MEGSALPEKNGFCSVVNDRAEGSRWLTLQVSTRAINPSLSSCISSTLFPHLLLPWVSGCKQIFVHWPFKRLSASLAISPC